MVVPEKLLMKKIKKREKMKKLLVASKQEQQNVAEPSEERECDCCHWLRLCAVAERRITCGLSNNLHFAGAPGSFVRLNNQTNGDSKKRKPEADAADPKGECKLVICEPMARGSLRSERELQ